jgi:hypothetical protein
MERAVREIVASGAFALLSGTVLWPPGAVYWTAVAAVVGDSVTLGIVLLLAVGLGVVFGRLTRVRVRRFLAGGVVAYAVGMAAIEVGSAPTSPAHLVWYGGVLACLVGGTVLGRRLGREGSPSTPTST